MCGIVGILGASQWRCIWSMRSAARYRGYDSAGVATLEPGSLRAGAPKQAAQPRNQTRARALQGTTGIGTRAGRPTASVRGQRAPHATTGSRSCTTASSRIFANCAANWSRPAPNSAPRPTPSGRHLVTHEMKKAVARRGGRGGAAAAARRVRARLPVRGRERSDDRCAQRLSARDRLWRGEMYLAPTPSRSRPSPTDQLP